MGCYEPWASKLETDLKQRLARAGIALKRYPGGLLKEPEDLRTKAGEPYKVFTPLWRALSASEAPASPIATPKDVKPLAKRVASDKLDDWKLLPTQPDWAGGMREAWEPGERGARRRLAAFLSVSRAGYTQRRNRPDDTGTSRLSPHLHFGNRNSDCSVRQAADSLVQVQFGCGRGG